MIQKLKCKILTIGALLALMLSLAAPVAVSAANIENSVCSGANTLGISEPLVDPDKQCEKLEGTGSGKANALIEKIINIISIIVGIIAVIMIIYAGFRYITSAGNQESVQTAKKTLIYAIIGLVIVALAQIIVQFVLKETTSNVNSSGGTKKVDCSTIKDPVKKAACEQANKAP